MKRRVEQGDWSEDAGAKWVPAVMGIAVATAVGGALVYFLDAQDGLVRRQRVHLVGQRLLDPREHARAARAAVAAKRRAASASSCAAVAVVVASGLLVLLLAVPCAYALAFRMIEGWRDTLFFFISTKFLPPVGIIVPIYIIMRDLQLLDNLLALVIMYTAMNLPIAIWMLRSFFEEVPPDVIQASQVDGADVFTQMTRIILPMVAPGLTATMFIGMIFAWNEFFFAVSLPATRAATVPMFMIGFVTSEGLFWAKLAAAGTMAMLPVVLVGWSAQRQLVRGLSLGAVK